MSPCSCSFFFDVIGSLTYVVYKRLALDSELLIWFVIEHTIRGCHQYKDILSPTIEELSCQWDFHSVTDPYVVPLWVLILKICHSTLILFKNKNHSKILKWKGYAMFTCKATLLHQDHNILSGAKMVETGYQHDNCDHSEVMQKIFEIAHTCLFLRKITDI